VVPRYRWTESIVIRQLITKRQRLVSVEEATARRVMEVNYWGVFYGMREQIQAMLPQGGGTIVNIASGAGLFAFPLSSPYYCASKHAVVGLAAGDTIGDRRRVGAAH
jgi:NAD(P)-dependent dehydrogenase (short-subunit alcohol dehydrogenase family)